jgi:hypothetical protein
MTFSRSPSNTGKRECAVSITVLQQVVHGPAWMLIMSIRVAGTMTSPAVMSAMRITPSSMMRDSAPMMLLSSASASVSMSSAVESGPG